MTIKSSYGTNAIAEFFPSFESNKMTLSKLNMITAHVGQTDIYGIKYVVKGAERYIVNGKTRSVQDGQYLLVNKGQTLSVDYRSHETVIGLCLSLDEKLLGQSYRYVTTSEEVLVGNPFDTCFVLPEFHETVFSGEDGLGKFIKRLVASPGYLKGQDPSDIYHQLAVELLESQKITQLQISSLKASKPSTKKELFNRVNAAKNILDADITRDISIAELARKATLSEFHFLRTFKKVFGCSPHQYLIKRRLEMACDLLARKKMSVTEIAYLAGFNDIFSFSKAFKKQFAVAPSSFCRVYAEA